MDWRHLFVNLYTCFILVFGSFFTLKPLPDWKLHKYKKKSKNIKNFFFKWAWDDLASHFFRPFLCQNFLHDKIMSWWKIWTWSGIVLRLPACCPCLPRYTTSRNSRDSSIKMCLSDLIRTFFELRSSIKEVPSFFSKSEKVRFWKKRGYTLN